MPIRLLNEGDWLWEMMLLIFREESEHELLLCAGAMPLEPIEEGRVELGGIPFWVLSSGAVPVSLGHEASRASFAQQLEQKSTDEEALGREMRAMERILSLVYGQKLKPEEV